MSEKQGRGRGERPLAIVFLDLARFSDWALEAGDDAALEPLRQVGRAVDYGKPRKLGSDYFGVDVNVAARVADAASPGQVLVSEAVCDHLQDGDVALRPQRRFKAQGTPKGMRVFSAEVSSRPTPPAGGSA